jgi:hypothetical protein
MRARGLVLAGAVVAGGLGFAIGSGPAEAVTEVRACYRTANDVLAAEEGGCPQGYFEVDLIASTSSGDYPVCVLAGEPLYRPGVCRDGAQQFWLHDAQPGTGIETCTQPRRTYHAPKQDGSCRPNRELVELAVAHG